MYSSSWNDTAKHQDDPRKDLEVERVFKSYKELCVLNIFSNEVYRDCIFPAFIATFLLLLVSCTFASVRTAHDFGFLVNLQFPLLVLAIVLASYILFTGSGEIENKSKLLLQMMKEQQNGRLRRIQKSLGSLKTHVGNFFYVTNRTYLVFCAIAIQQAASLLLTI